MVNDRVYQPWQEAVEREVILPVYNVEALGYRLVPDAFSFPAEKQFEYLRDGGGQIVGVIVRERQVPVRRRRNHGRKGCGRTIQGQRSDSQHHAFRECARIPAAKTRC